MWSEHVKPDSIDSRIWPRLAAVAERLWSPQNVQDPNDMYRRLERVSVQLEEFGLEHEANTDRMLRRILGTREYETFAVFVDTLMPAAFGQRSRGQKPTQLTPYTRLVDAVVPDPPTARDLQRRVDALVADSPMFERNRAELLQLFETWRSSAPMVSQIVNSHPQLQEVNPRVAELDGLGQLGQEAVTYLQTHTAPPQQWVADSNKKLDEAAKPKGLVRFAVTDSLRKLVQAASGTSAAPPTSTGN
jgi:hexosaminidase